MGRAMPPERSRASDVGRWVCFQGGLPLSKRASSRCLSLIVSIGSQKPWSGYREARLAEFAAEAVFDELLARLDLVQESREHEEPAVDSDIRMGERLD